MTRFIRRWVLFLSSLYTGKSCDSGYRLGWGIQLGVVNAQQVREDRLTFCAQLEDRFKSSLKISYLIPRNKNRLMALTLTYKQILEPGTNSKSKLRT